MSIKAIYLDIGGVLLTNGWDTAARKKAAEQFGFDFDEMNKRHGLMFSTHEIGKLSLDTYLDYTLFNKERTFSRDEFKTFMYAQSQPYPEMLNLIKTLKETHGLKIGVISNEGRELTEYRVKNWLIDFVDFFCVSCFVHVKKPDPEIFTLAIDIGRIPADQVVYIEDRKPFVEIANGLGLNGLHHTSYETTRAALENLLEQS